MPNKRSNRDADNSEYRLIRSGSRSVTSNRGMGRSARYAKTEALAAPQLDALGHRAFTAKNLEALAIWLQDSEWPRSSMNIYSLEGYLVAMLVLPLGLRTNVWMPSVWNEPGWKIPLALQVREKYDEFLELLIGFMRHIDAGFQASPPRFEMMVGSVLVHRNRTAAQRAQDWVHGFGQALAHCAHVNLMPDPSTKAALQAIAAHATETHRSRAAQAKVSTELQQAVLTLAQARSSRGPLSAPVVESKPIRTRS